MNRTKFLKAVKEYCLKSGYVEKENMKEIDWDRTLDNIDEVLSCMGEE
jgi:hypothetical protein